jgi:DNA-binding CsgD family transcriptional regulator
MPKNGPVSKLKSIKRRFKTMEPHVTVEWVKQNKKTIESKMRRRMIFAPYSMEEYMQEAFIASLIAFRQYPDTSSSVFRQAFWRNFKDAVAEMVPRPPKLHDPSKSIRKRRISNKESKSIPCTACNYNDDGACLEEIAIPDDIKYDYRNLLYTWVRPALTEKEARVLYLSLGLDNEITLSERDISKLLKVSRRSVRDLLENSLTKFNNLLQEKQNKKILLMFIKDYKHEFHNNPKKKRSLR